MMGNIKFSKILRSKLFIFTIQIGLIILILHIILKYEYPILFDSITTNEQRIIIQFLGNLIFYDFDFSFLLIFSTWFIATLVSIILLNNSAKVVSSIIKLFFLPNFFLYVFLYQYNTPNFVQYFSIQLPKSLIIFSVLVICGALIPYVLNKSKKQNKSSQLPNIQKLVEENTTTCSRCGIQFRSVPIYCYECSEKIKRDSS